MGFIEDNTQMKLILLNSSETEHVDSEKGTKHLHFSKTQMKHFYGILKIKKVLKKGDLARINSKKIPLTKKLLFLTSILKAIYNNMFYFSLKESSPPYSLQVVKGQYPNLLNGLHIYRHSCKR
ncbi:MAG: hypothetical protein Q8859_08890 [Bacteroidota bacterium]|nr:hypothetical protein [Bacteroidota bacterium]